MELRPSMSDDPIHAALERLEDAKRQLAKDRDLIDQQLGAIDQKLNAVNTAIASLKAIDTDTLTTSPNSKHRSLYIPKLGPYAKRGLQGSVLDVIQKSDKPLTVRQIINELESGGREMSEFKSAYNTVYVGLRRLTDKGRVMQIVGDGGDHRFGKRDDASTESLRREQGLSGIDKAIKEVTGTE